jgi:hypothetical protein
LSPVSPTTIVSNTAEHYIPGDGIGPFIRENPYAIYNGWDQADVIVNGMSYPVSKYYTEESFEAESFASLGQYVVGLESDLFVSANWGNYFVLKCEADGGMGCMSEWVIQDGTVLKDLLDIWRVTESMKY